MNDVQSTSVLDFSGAVLDKLKTTGHSGRSGAIDPMIMFAATAGDAHLADLDGLSAPELAIAHIAKSTTALLADGVGDKLVLLGPQLTLIIDPDDVPGDTSTTATIDVDGEHIISQIHTIGDQDFFKVELVQGQLYQFGEYAYTGGDGPSGVPLADAYLELYDADGNLIVSADGGGPNTPSGLDALLTYEADYTGTYYINARGYDEDPTNGTTGDVVGDYELFVDDVTGLVQGPYYEPEELLYSIDWGGVLVDGTARNPDGDEGIRPTGNDQGEPDDKGTGIEGKNVIFIYFAKPGDIYLPEDPTNPGLPPAAVAVGAKDYEIDAVWTALHEFEKVADVVYVETQDRDEANFHYVTYTGTPGPGVSLLGSMAPPQESDEGLALFNSNDERWNAEGLAQGGFSFVTLIHEFGHGHGLAHPHDTGGGSGILRGVEADGPVADYTLGDFELNQGVFTMMSYEDGWQSSPYGNAETDAGYGYLGGLMALDIAAIQDKYGVNEDWATGNDVYVLKDVNEAGTYFSSIWDGGGTDLIRYNGLRNSNIDLRAATLQYETGGGGWVSFADGIYGGFTIANAVEIENALSGDGNDTITGNDLANVIRSRGGDDSISGGNGDDRIIGGDGADTLHGDNGADVIICGTGDDFANGGDGADNIGGRAGNDTLDGSLGADFIIGQKGDDLILGNLGRDTINGGGGADRLYGNGGDDELNGAAGVDYIEAGKGDDRVSGGGDGDTLLGGQHDDVVLGNAGNDMIFGNAGADVLRGGSGNDHLDGGDGNDYLHGGNGGDVFEFADDFGFDTVGDFTDTEDRLWLVDLREENGGSALTFDQLLVTQTGTTTRIEIDLDRNGVADLIDLDGDGTVDAVHIDLINCDANDISAADFVF